MKVAVGTSVIVEIDRGNETVINLLKSLAEKDFTLVISAVTVSEILTGSYLTREPRKSVLTAKEVLSQFIWIELDGRIAEKTAQILAFLISEKATIEYQDAAIAATVLAGGCDYLLTLNKKDFLKIPALAKRVYTPQEFVQIAEKE